MGQYYLAIILAEKEESKPEIIRMFMEVIGQKLMEHSYINNSSISYIEYQLTKDGMFYKSRVVWAGDYADKEEGTDKNLHNMTDDLPNKFFTIKMKITKDYHYIINHTKKQFVDKQKQKIFHPLPLLTAEGNGRGGGDYSGKGTELIGIWARDVISVEKDKPEGYDELECNFDSD